MRRRSLFQQSNKATALYPRADDIVEILDGKLSTRVCFLHDVVRVPFLSVTVDGLAAVLGGGRPPYHVANPYGIAILSYVKEHTVTTHTDLDARAIDVKKPSLSL